MEIREVDIVSIVVSFIVAVVSTVFAVVKWLSKHMLDSYNERIAKSEQRIEELEKSLQRIETKIEELKTDLSITYHRREDAIREYTAINAKLDRLWEVIVRLKDERK
ncbi:MAG: hypothetical protein P3W91_000800 [Fervidobacterium sp.]|nr:hypothetical protein [Fervidobacterium sp.]